ncbi:hypothetical protein N658DRAFT_531573, partial [Parathielavia hyrcaniae]
ARTGAIGLKDFLFRAKVPRISTPYCECGRGRETVEHLAVWCRQPPKPRTWPATECHRIPVPVSGPRIRAMDLATQATYAYVVYMPCPGPLHRTCTGPAS